MKINGIASFFGDSEPKANGIAKVRKAWLAALLSFVCPGLGQLYNGQLNWCLIAFSVSLVFSVLGTVFFFGSLSQIFSMMMLGLVLDVFFSVHAFRSAKKIGSMVLKKYQSRWMYILFALFLFGFPDGFGYLIPSRLLSFQIPSASMVPTLLVGDRLVADGWSYWKGDPQRGDVVVFLYPKDESIRYVKRLIGLPGDRVELRGGVLYINGTEISQKKLDVPPVIEAGQTFDVLEEDLMGVKHIIYRARNSFVANDFGPVLISEGKYFFMGDNRDRSSDSRFWGQVTRKAIVGKMRYIFFSWDSEEKRLRSNRIGLNVN